jgi:hypothetical protein
MLILVGCAVGLLFARQPAPARAPSTATPAAPASS